jgi:hypothetical protein
MVSTRPEGGALKPKTFMSYVNNKRRRRLDAEPAFEEEEEERAEFDFNRMELPSASAVLNLLPPPQEPAVVDEPKIYELAQIVEAEFLIGQLIPRLSPPYAVKPITDQLSVDELTIIFAWIKDGLRDARLSVLSDKPDE